MSAIALVLINTQLSAQCNVNDKYDKIVSGYHGSIAQKKDGSYAVWGQTMKSDGVTDALVPQDLNSTNYSALGSNTVLKVAMGGAGGGGADQMIALTSAGLYAWGGGKGNVLSTTIYNATAFGAVTTPAGGAGSNASYPGLPTGITPSNVQEIFATYKTLIILTKIVNNVGGNVYVITQNTLADEANGGTASTPGSSTWQEVKTNSTTYLSNVTEVRGQVSSATINAFMAVTSNGSVYTWGNSAYLGSSTASQALNYATAMTLPSEFSSTNVPSMIGVTGGIKDAAAAKNTYYLISSSGNLYAMGDNSQKQCGDFTTTERQAWVSCDSASGKPFHNAAFITCQEADASSVPCVAVITTTGALYDWGGDNGELLGRGSNTVTTYDPGIANGSAGSVAITAEMGGTPWYILNLALQLFVM